MMANTSNKKDWLCVNIYISANLRSPRPFQVMQSLLEVRVGGAVVWANWTSNLYNFNRRWAYFVYIYIFSSYFLPSSQLHIECKLV